MSTLTQRDVLTLATLVNMAQEGSRVVRALDQGGLVHGTARHLVVSPDNFGFARGDIRDAYLRVTLDSGFDVAWPVSDLVEDLQDGLFSVSPR